MDEPTEEAVDSHQGPDPDQLAAFLATAPDELQGWAQAQLARVRDTQEAPTPEDADAVGLEAFADDLDDQPAPRPKAASRPKKKGLAATGLNKVNLVLVALLAAAVVIIVQQWGAESQTSTASPHGSAAAEASAMTTYEALDQARVDELEATAQAEPGNVDVRLQLSQLYLNAGLYQDAIGWLDDALEIDPDNLEALLAIGVAQYQIGDEASAERNWLHATEVAPTQAEPWYNLGFLYMAADPANLEAAEEALNKVIELAPDSDLAQSAADHLERFLSSSTSTGG